MNNDIKIGVFFGILFPVLLFLGRPGKTSPRPGGLYGQRMRTVAGLYIVGMTGKWS